MTRWPVAPVLVLSLLAPLGCSGNDDAGPAQAERATTTIVAVASSGAPSTTSTTRSVPAGCGATPIVHTSTSTEVQGVSSDVSLYGLLFTEHDPIHQGDEVKIVWRMTGRGDLAVSSSAPDGTPRALTFGPEPHISSSYNRPGDEWGTGFRFDQPGCWRIQLMRSTGSGDVWLNVVA